jgi:hypothetical protein
MSETNQSLNVVDDSILLNSDAMNSTTSSSQQDSNNLTDTTVPDVEPLVDQNTALNVLVQAVYIGQQRGVWKIEESILLKRAINTFKSTQVPVQPVSETSTS